jgi:AcrR family transcriptional regulator
MVDDDRSNGRHGLMRQEIMKVAVSLFEQNSITKVTLAQVAQELNLTKSAIYHYFPTKDDLLRSIFAGWTTSCRNEIETLLELPLRTEEMLREVLRTHARQITSEFGLYVLSVRTESELPEPIRIEVRRLKHDTDLLVRDLVSKGQREGVFKPMDPRLAQLAGTGMFSWMWGWYRSDRDDVERIAEEFSRIFVDGIRMRRSDGSEMKVEGSPNIPISAEYHATEIRYHTGALRCLVGNPPTTQTTSS